jgi:hypothetical protein
LQYVGVQESGRGREIRAFRPPEPYNGKGVKYLDGRIFHKEGRAAQGAHQTHYQSGCERAAAAERVSLLTAHLRPSDRRSQASLKTGADISAPKLVGKLVASELPSPA